MRENKGVATKIEPLTISNVDATIRQLDNLIRSGISPRIYGVVNHPIDVSGGHVIIVRIPKSWNLPHMVVKDEEFVESFEEARKVLKPLFETVWNAAGGSMP